MISVRRFSPVSRRTSKSPSARCASRRAPIASLARIIVVATTTWIRQRRPRAFVDAFPPSSSRLLSTEMSCTSSCACWRRSAWTAFPSTSPRRRLSETSSRPSFLPGASTTTTRAAPRSRTTSPRTRTSTSLATPRWRPRPRNSPTPPTSRSPARNLASPSPSPPTSANSATTTMTTTTVAHRDHPRPDPHPNLPARRPRRASAISPSLLARTPSVSVSWRLSTKPSPAPWRSTPRPVRRSARRLNPGSPRLVSPNPESPRLVSPPIASPLVPRLVLRRRDDPHGAEAARTCRDSNARFVGRVARARRRNPRRNARRRSDDANVMRCPRAPRRKRRSRACAGRANEARNRARARASGARPPPSRATRESEARRRLARPRPSPSPRRG